MSPETTEIIIGFLKSLAGACKECHASRQNCSMCSAKRAQEVLQRYNDEQEIKHNISLTTDNATTITRFNVVMGIIYNMITIRTGSIVIDGWDEFRKSKTIRNMIKHGLLAHAGGSKKGRKVRITTKGLEYAEYNAGVGNFDKKHEPKREEPFCGGC